MEQGGQLSSFFQGGVPEGGGGFVRYVGFYVASTLPPRLVRLLRYLSRRPSLKKGGEFP
ncbi:MAG: hypothetical protein JWQ38_2748 [Flavipsychrobacter sp.]|nr:hypothetical protein [Flavipsychrobacter sp.]